MVLNMQIKCIVHMPISKREDLEYKLLYGCVCMLEALRSTIRSLLASVEIRFHDVFHVLTQTKPESSGNLPNTS